MHDPAKAPNEPYRCCRPTAYAKTHGDGWVVLPRIYNGGYREMATTGGASALHSQPVVPRDVSDTRREGGWGFGWGRGSPKNPRDPPPTGVRHSNTSLVVPLDPHGEQDGEQENQDRPPRSRLARPQTGHVLTRLGNEWPICCSTEPCSPGLQGRSQGSGWEGRGGGGGATSATERRRLVGLWLR